jgi:hypothetical protein
MNSPSSPAKNWFLRSQTKKRRGCSKTNTSTTYCRTSKIAPYRLPRYRPLQPFFSRLSSQPDFQKKKKSFVDFLNNEATEAFTDDGDMRFLKKLHHVRRAFQLDPGWAKHNLPFVERIVAHDGRASKTELYRNPAPSLVYNIALGEVYTHTAAEIQELALSRLLESSSIA